MSFIDKFKAWAIVPEEEAATDLPIVEPDVQSPPEVEVLHEDISALKKVLEDSNVAGIDFYELSNMYDKTNNWTTALQMARDLHKMLSNDSTTVDQAIYDSFGVYLSSLEKYKDTVKDAAEKSLREHVGTDGDLYETHTKRLEEIEAQLATLQEEKSSISEALPELKAKIQAAKQVSTLRMQSFVKAYTQMLTYVEQCKHTVTPLLNLNTINTNATTI